MGAGNLHETNAYLLLYERAPAPTSRHRGRALKQSIVPPSATSWRAARPHHVTPPTSQEQRSTASGATSAAATLAVGAGATRVGAVDVSTGSASFLPGLPGARSNGGTSHAATPPGNSSTLADGGGVGGEDGEGGGGVGSSGGGGGLEPPRTSDPRPRPPGAPSGVGLPSDVKGNAGAGIPSGRASDGSSDRAPPGGGEERPSTTPASTYSAAAAAAEGPPAGEVGDSPGRGSATEGSNGAAPRVPGVAGSPEGGGAEGGRRRFSGRTDSADWGWSSDCGVR